MNVPVQRFYNVGTEWNRLMVRFIKEEFIKHGGLTIADSVLEQTVQVVAENAVNRAIRNMFENL